METKAKVTEKDKLNEAVKRMTSLDIDQAAIIGLVKSGIKPVSFDGMDGLYGLRTEMDNMISDFENEHNVLVYFIIFTPSEYGDMVSYLYVSDDEDEWEDDRSDLVDGYAMTWTANIDHPELSEFGSIAISKTECGGLQRVA